MMVKYVCNVVRDTAFSEVTHIVLVEVTGGVFVRPIYFAVKMIDGAIPDDLKQVIKKRIKAESKRKKEKDKLKVKHPLKFAWEEEIEEWGNA